MYWPKKSYKPIKLLRQQIALLRGQIAEIEIKTLIAQHRQLAQMHTLLRSVPSVGLLLSAHFMVLTDGFERRQPVNSRPMSAFVPMSTPVAKRCPGPRRVGGMGRQCCASCYI